MGVKHKKENNITPLYILNVEVILHYITHTRYDIVNDTQRQHVIASPKIWEQNIKKEKNIILLYTLNVKVILHYITLTGCDMANDTQRQHVIASPKICEQDIRKKT